MNRCWKSDAVGGEICIFHGLRGGRAVGIDYSSDAIRLAQLKAAVLHSRAEFVAAPFAQAMQRDESFDCILASEFIEHIAPDEATTFMRLAFERLRPGGRLFIFTYPNTLQRKYGYRLLRLASQLRGHALPARQPDTVDEHYKLFHLNEQNRLSLLRLARHAGFSECRAGYDNAPRTRAARALMAGPFRDLFGTDLYLIAGKAAAGPYAT
jgi:cyclopropane fatty-acyl-phospholipid synthase-like methyltransferase